MQHAAAVQTVRVRVLQALALDFSRRTVVT